jgi:transcriptional regulator with XRE-family HTH domain
MAAKKGTKQYPQSYGDPDVGRRLRTWRKREDLTQEEVARLAGTHPKVVGSWESGRRRLPSHKAIEIARAYPSLDLDWLFLGKEPGPNDVDQRIFDLERSLRELRSQMRVAEQPADYGQTIPASWVDDFISQLNRSAIVNEVASIFTSVRSSERGRELKPHEIDEVIADAAPRILDRFREYVEQRRKKK